MNRNNIKKNIPFGDGKPVTYSVNNEEFAKSLCQTSLTPLLAGSGAKSSLGTGSSYVYDTKGEKVGSLLVYLIGNEIGGKQFMNIQNCLSLNSGLILNWSATTYDANLLASLFAAPANNVNQYLAVASCQLGVNPYFGQTFNVQVLAEDGVINLVVTPLQPSIET